MSREYSIGLLYLPIYNQALKEESRSQWPRGQSRGFAAACLLGLWVRISPASWMSVSRGCCVFSGRVPWVGWSLVQRSPTECGVSKWVWSWILDNEEDLTHLGDCAMGGGDKIKELGPIAVDCSDISLSYQNTVYTQEVVRLSLHSCALQCISSLLSSTHRDSLKVFALYIKL